MKKKLIKPDDKTIAVLEKQANLLKEYKKMRDTMLESMENEKLQNLAKTIIFV